MTSTTVKWLHWKKTIILNGSLTTLLVEQAMSSNGTNVVTYENVLRTRLDYTGSVEPVMPLFHVPFKCTVDSTYDFVFHGGWHPDVTSFSAETGALQDQEGQMNLYHDKHVQQQ